jgi:hypothetical protein
MTFKRNFDTPEILEFELEESLKEIHLNDEEDTIN